MAFVHLIGFDGSSAALMISLTGIVLILASSWIIFDLVLTHSLGNNQLIAVLAAGSLPFLYPLTYWTLRGMEVGALTFFCLLLLRATINHIRDGRVRIQYSMALPIVFGIATRFDFAIFCVVAIAGLLMWGPAYVKARLAAQYGAMVAGTAGLVCLAQKLYWGSWLPNTYHLKMDGVSPIDRIARGFASSAKTTALFAIIADVKPLLRHNSPASATHNRLVFQYCSATNHSIIRFTCPTGYLNWCWRHSESVRILRKAPLHRGHCVHCECSHNLSHLVHST
jgi:hypothetical protein